MKIIDVATGDTRASFYPYGGDSASSVEVALGGVNGDGSLDIVLSAATPGGTEVKAIDAEGTQLADFYALDPAILPGPHLPPGISTVTAGSRSCWAAARRRMPRPPVANGPEQRAAIYEPDGSSVGGFTASRGFSQGGVRVAVADLDHDRRPEIVTAPGPGTAAEIGVFSQQMGERP